jgi:AraC-like DNA-binding protein
MIGMDDFFFLYHLCRLNVVRLGLSEEKHEIFSEGPFSTSMMSQFPLASLQKELFRGEKKGTGLIADDQGLRFFYVFKEESIYLLGPFLSDREKPSSFFNRQFTQRNRISILSQGEVDAYLHALTLYGRDSSGFSRETAETVTVHNPVFTGENDLSLEEIEAQYTMERNLRGAIASGNRKEVIKVMGDNRAQNDFSYRLPQNPLRAQKNMAIVLNTIGRHSAEKGGLPFHLLHSMSEEYALKIEGCRNEEELMKINRTILVDYCEAVHSYGIGNHSAPVVRVSRYILSHLNRKLSLEKLARIGEINKSYLSRLFHRETGQTVSAYIREKRITEARWLLTHGEQSITNIALELGFEDVNYFSRCFAKETGVPPSEYRRFQGHGTGQKDFDGLPGEG